MKILNLFLKLLIFSVATFSLILPPACNDDGEEGEELHSRNGKTATDNDDDSDDGDSDDDDDNNDDNDDKSDVSNDDDTDAGESQCDHDPKDCDYRPKCSVDEDCPCGFACKDAACLSLHCYCAELRGEDPCGKGMECDENSPTGLCVKVTTPCQSDSECLSKGANWSCVNGKCVRASSACDTADPNACRDYAPAVYECVNGMCAGAGTHGNPCPNHTDFDCATGNVCIESTCRQSCQNIGEACPPPASGTTCYQQTMLGLPVGPPYCK
ncbi:MAG: hypothetical protein Kow0090_15540 [Myxococcota bacterium]